MKKLKSVKSLFVASLVVSFLFVAYAIYLLLNNGDSIKIICLILGGVILGYNDWKTFLSKKKP